jgi:TRAP-type C4-dicarboxylate transport system substrate-binding protein
MTMVRRFLCAVLLASGIWAPAASAEPIKLKLSLVTSDRALIYLGAVKPFVDAVNAEAKGLLEIEVFFSGALEKQPTLQPQLVADGGADLAFIFPGYTPERFYDNTVIELPGLFQDTREASLVYTRMIASGAIKGYGDYVVVAALSSPAESIHGRRPIDSIASLDGMTVRTNNATEAMAVRKLGMRPVPMPMNLVAEALSDGKIDSATAPLPMLFEFGVGRVSSYHYMLEISGAPLALVMNRKKFDSLPRDAQDIIRKYSGEWPVGPYLQSYEESGRQVIDQLQSNPRRKVAQPSPADRAAAEVVFKSVIDEWAAKAPANRQQLETARAEIARLRAGR